MVKPIITVKQENDGWHLVEWYSDNTANRDNKAYPDQKTAEVAGREFAQNRSLSYVTPDTVFVTLITFEKKSFFFRRKVYYLAVEHPFDGKCKPISNHVCSNAFHLFEIALKHSIEKKLPFEPEFYLDERVLLK